MGGGGQAVAGGAADGSGDHGLADPLAQPPGQPAGERAVEGVRGAAEQVLGHHPDTPAQRQQGPRRGVRGVDGDVHRRVAAADDEDPPAGELLGAAVGVAVHLLGGERPGYGGSGSRGTRLWPLATTTASTVDRDRAVRAGRRARSSRPSAPGRTRLDGVPRADASQQAEPVGVVGAGSRRRGRGRGSRASRAGIGWSANSVRACWCSGAGCGRRASRAPRTPTGRRRGRRRRSRPPARRASASALRVARPAGPAPTTATVGRPHVVPSRHLIQQLVG